MGQFNLFGLLLPTIVPAIILGALSFLPVRYFMTRQKLYQWVWHPALVDLTILTIFTAIFVKLFGTLG